MRPARAPHCIRARSVCTRVTRSLWASPGDPSASYAPVSALSRWYPTRARLEAYGRRISSVNLRARSLHLWIDVVNQGDPGLLVEALRANMEIVHCPTKHICRKVLFKTTTDSNGIWPKFVAVIPDPRAARARAARSLRFSPARTVDGYHPSSPNKKSLPAVSAFSRDNCQNSLRMDKLFGASYRPYYLLLKGGERRD